MRTRSTVVTALVVAASLLLVSRAEAQAATGKVAISYALTRITQIASNQLAIWIEDQNGGFVRTVYVTGFAGKRAGWKIRKQVCPTWVGVAGVQSTPQAEIDAVSGSTPRSGTWSVTWDLTDRSGTPVPAGTYRYRVEGNISWENTVLWTGTIRVGGSRDSSQALAAFSPAGADKLGTLISAVSAVYEPGS